MSVCFISVLEEEDRSRYFCLIDFDWFHKVTFLEFCLVENPEELEEVSAFDFNVSFGFVCSSYEVIGLLDEGEEKAVEGGEFVRDEFFHKVGGDRGEWGGDEFGFRGADICFL